MKRRPVDMPVTIAEQDEVLERIFAMVELGDKSAPKPIQAPPIAKRKKSRRKAREPIGVRFEVALSLEEQAMLAALTRCREICKPRKRSLVEALRYTIAVATFCHADSPELDWPEHYRAFVHKAKRGVVLRGRIPAAEIQALKRMASEMRVPISAAMRSTVVSLYTAYRDENVLP